MRLAGELADLPGNDRPQRGRQVVADSGQDYQAGSVDGFRGGPGRADAQDGVLVAVQDPGASATVTFTVTAHDLASWDTTSNSWIAGAASYQILVGDSSRNLPLTGSLSVSSPITANAMS